MYVGAGSQFVDINRLNHVCVHIHNSHKVLSDMKEHQIRTLASEFFIASHLQLQQWTILTTVSLRMHSFAIVVKTPALSTTCSSTQTPHKHMSSGHIYSLDLWPIVIYLQKQSVFCILVLISSPPLRSLFSNLQRCCLGFVCHGWRLISLSNQIYCSFSVFVHWYMNLKINLNVTSS